MPAAPSLPRHSPTLRRGATGDAVVTLQRRLCTHLTDLRSDDFVDGDFGPSTELQVKRFQRSKRLSADGVVGKSTWTELQREPSPTVSSPAGATAASADRKEAAKAASPARGGGALAERLFRALKRKGYVTLDDSKPYHLNIVGIRSPSTTIGHFDDRLIVAYRDDAGHQHADEYPITTDPGEYYTQTKLLNKAGAAILVPGQYKDSYKLGKHQGKYEALCQLGGKVKVWRDGNKDATLDRAGSIDEGWFGINIHRAASSGTTAKVGRYSAGCQVFQRADDFNVFMAAVKKSVAIRGNQFTYTLLEEDDFK